ncbi:LPXTG cell wall anchor domain-containing protein [Nakamurella antarctica]|uniref:LPXTG cell wall anchor domain-containing protein n=1 Tax=Nakamurella antarctica TaxID=1902245 RepID=A0A3G8ZJA0_9ACTN|nr:LPXTG cell wall anchor domain-containing protein [Nakamurella antarctica]AZI56915.1 LPXTG cell wall anchor domain-containing protein [Nakamurella antarctica]
MFSTPTSLGGRTVSGDGTIGIDVPADLPLGPHKIAVYRSGGALMGWAPLTVTARPELPQSTLGPRPAAAAAPIAPAAKGATPARAATATLPNTGVNVNAILGFAIILLLVGSAALVWAGRRPARAAGSGAHSH